MDKDTRLIKTYAKSIAEDLIGYKLNYFDNISLVSTVIDNKEKYPINTIFNLFAAVKNALDNMKIPIKKIAYPHGDNGLTVEAPHNIAQWIKAMQVIYSYAGQGVEISKAFDLVTEKWDKMDRMDFKNWMAFYQQGGHKVYKKADELKKTAQRYLEIGSGGFLPLEQNDLRATIPGVPSRIPDMRQFNKAVEEDELIKKQKEDQNKLLEKEELKRQIKALIGRLNAAERIATTKGIDKALGPVYETWLKALHDLKREIQIAPLRNVKSILLTDLIIRKGNQLLSNGFKVPANLMYKLAQVAPPPLDSSKTEEENKVNLEQPEEEQEQPKEGQEDLPIPAMPSFDTTEMDDDSWADEFLKGLSGLIDDNDVQDINDSSDDLYVDDSDLIITAQTAPLPTKPEVMSGSQSELDKALSNITVQDIILRLESLANIFKNRELPRQLALIDIMMDRLGIASYFPNLAEATNKSLESNQYVLTRVEDILGKLRGTIETSVQIDLNKVPPSSGIQQNLKQQEQKDDARQKAREKARESQEDAQLAGQTVVPLQELNQPAQIQQNPQPVRV